MDRGGFKWKEPPSQKEAKDNRRQVADEVRPQPRENRRRDTSDEAPKKQSEEPATSTAVSLENNNASDDLKIASKFGAAAAAKWKPIPKTPSSVSAGQSVAVERPSISKTKAPSGPMMLVTVNDRLGTKKEIPCLGSDTIEDFKKLVAMQIGRKPHEIMLKRQSERALKDKLTLDDYEISNGVQLDLELNTGD